MSIKKAYLIDQNHGRYKYYIFNVLKAILQDHCAGCGFDSQSRKLTYLIFSFFHFSNEAKCGIEYRHSTLHLKKYTV